MKSDTFIFVLIEGIDPYLNEHWSSHDTAAPFQSLLRGSRERKVQI